MPVELELNGME